MSLKEKVNTLIDVLKNTEINELEITSFWGFQKIRLKKKPDTTVLPNFDNSNHQISIEKPQSGNIDTTQKPPAIKTDEIANSTQLENKNDIASPENINQESANLSKDYIEQKAPLVGTFYISPKPGEPAFVNVGDRISKGQTLCIIEAMKIFNEIESDFDGTVVEILIDDASPVEFDQPLFRIEPN